MQGIETEGHRSRTRLKVGFCLLFACFNYLTIIGVIVATECKGSKSYSKVTLGQFSVTSSEGRNGQRSNKLRAINRALGVCDPWLVQSVCFLVKPVIVFISSPEIH